MNAPATRRTHQEVQMTAGVITRHSRRYRREQAKQIVQLPADQRQAAYAEINKQESRRRKSLIASHKALMKSRTS